jgi:SAM domain (Sterile alpha motif)
MDLAEWLRSLALEQYAAAFNENHVAAEDLPFLTADDLKEIGISAVGHRRRLLAAIAALQDKPAGNRSQHSGRNSLTVAERRQITVLFCDIVGSIPLSRGLDSESE